MIPFLYLAPLVVLGELLPARSALVLDDVRATYGLLQPERVEPAYFPPHDQLIYRFRARGFRTDRGQVDGEVAAKLTDARGKTVLLKNSPLKVRPLITADGAMTYYAHLPLSDPLPPGEYTAQVTVTDHVSGASGTFERKVIVQPVEFAVVSVLFGRDPKMTMPAPPAAFAGEQLFYHLNVIGFDAGDGRVDVNQKVEVLEAATGKVLPNAHEFAVRQPVYGDGGRITFNGCTGILLHPGEYRLRFTVTDRVADRTVTAEVPVRVLAP